MWQEFPEQRARLLEYVGGRLARETLRFEWRDTSPLPAPSPRLSFRSLVTVGDDAFIAAIEAVSQGSLDRRIRQEIEQDGPAEAARASFEMYQKLAHDPGWWELAYTPQGELAGLVMPARNPTFPVIGYIGVTPRCRGQGYIDALLARGTATLRAAGATVIRADTDTGNTPMANAFRRAGYTQFARRREYTLNLSRLPADR
jgi:ribosomal protein S18 acetylase RimI-like enzyme